MEDVYTGCRIEFQGVLLLLGFLCNLLLILWFGRLPFFLNLRDRSLRKSILSSTAHKKAFY